MDNKKIVNVLLQQLKNAHETLESTFEGTSSDHAHFLPTGTANSVAASYAHLLFSEDMVLCGMLKGTAPLCTTTWKDKTGVSELMPQMGEEWDKYPIWAKNVKITEPDVREYAKAVYAQSEAYLESLTDDDLTREIDLSDHGMGKMPAIHIVTEYLIGHSHDVTGEISAIKGVQGLKGYPF